jgi:predicted DNA-binding protein with PD1-like motif
MEYRKLDSSGERTYVVVLDDGDEFSESVLEFARKERLKAAHFTAIGAFCEVELGWFNTAEREYERNRLVEQLEVLSLLGNIAEFEGQPKIHAHVVLGKRDSSAWGGHLLAARVRPTLEITATVSPAHLQRRIDAATGLPLLEPHKTSDRSRLAS